MSVARKRAPKRVKPFIYNDNEDILFLTGISLIKGQGAVVIDILRSRPGIWNSRELAESLRKHPDFISMRAPELVANWWIYKLRHLGLIDDARPDHN
jgi:hypothetical protein